MFLGINMKKRRNEMGVSQAELAEAMRTSVACICKLEKGITKKPRVSTVNRIALVLEVDYDFFFRIL